MPNAKQFCYAPPRVVDFGNGVTIEASCTRDVRSHGKRGKESIHLARVPLGDHADMVIRWPGEPVSYETAAHAS